MCDSDEIFDYNAFIGKYYNVDMKSIINVYIDSIADSLAELTKFFEYHWRICKKNW